MNKGKIQLDRDRVKSVNFRDHVTLDSDLVCSIF